jgi:membrane protein
VAAGLAFFGVFSLLPAIAVAGLTFRWLVDPDEIGNAASEEAEYFPEGTYELIEEFLTVVPTSLAGGLGLSLNLVVVLWTVQRASSGLITALNVVYDEDERRHRVRREIVAMVIAAGGIIFLFVVLYMLAVVPILAELPRYAALGDYLTLRWPALAVMLLVGLSLLYGFAPCRGRVSWFYIAASAAVTTVAWILLSLLFSLYMNSYGDWDPFYGSVTTPVVLMAWMFISSFVIMLGAEINAQLEAQAHPGDGAGVKSQLDHRERA